MSLNFLKSHTARDAVDALKIALERKFSHEEVPVLTCHTPEQKELRAKEVSEVV